MAELVQKNAIITGANRGIGNAIVRKFAENGCNIWACARTCNKAFEEKMQQIADQNGVQIWPVYFELSDFEQIKAAFKEIYKTKLPIDILVNAAGIVNTELFQMTSIQEMRKVFDVNFFGPIQLTQLVLKTMTRQKSGSIINISSVAGQDANPTNCTYGSSKSAINSFSRILASEIGRLGIRVNVVAPGPTDTDMIERVRAKVGDSMLDRCAMERLAKPDEIAETVVFLASDKASFINGQIIRVDGGAK